MALAIAMGAGTGAARADEPATPSPTPTPSPISATAEGALQCPRCFPEHWTSEDARFFVALRLDAGYLYLKPRFAFGFGKPFSGWAGIDVAPYVTPDSAGGYSGVHLQIDWFEARASGRLVHAFTRQFLSPQSSYNLVDLAELTGHPSNYVDLEAEVSGAIPAGPGSLLVLGTASSIQLVPAGYFVYDEALRVVVSPPAVYRARIGYSIPFMPERNARAGIVAEVLEIPDRKAQVYRAGVVATFDVDDHLQAIASFLVPVWGPDSLGFLGADYTELGIRYRWATGHAEPPREVVVPDEIALTPR
jgi:hypothetical protein